jgi:hypothetical protein
MRKETRNQQSCLAKNRQQKEDGKWKISEAHNEFPLKTTKGGIKTKHKKGPKQRQNEKKRKENKRDPYRTNYLSHGNTRWDIDSR